MFVGDNVPPVTENPADFAPLPWSGPLHCVRYDGAYWRQMVEAAGLSIVRDIPLINDDGQTAFYLQKPPPRLFGLSRYFRRSAAVEVKPDAGALPSREPKPGRQGGGPRCFVGFFGLNRYPPLTHDAIRRNIVTPLQTAGAQPVLAAHYNCPDVVHSPRSGEINVPLVKPERNELNLELSWEEPQSTGNLGDLLPIVLATPLRQEPDPEGLIRTNALHQLHSLRRLGQVLDALNPDSFDVFCFLRADLLYDPMPVAEIFDLLLGGSVDLVTPDWHEWAGLNDRFAFCSRRAAPIYLNRIDWVREQCAERQFFHSESLLGDVVRKTGLRHARTPMKAKRVRATGLVREEDFNAGSCP